MSDTASYTRKHCWEKFPGKGPSLSLPRGPSLISVLLGVCMSVYLSLRVSGEGLVQGVIRCLTVEQCS